jgi:hypothetical protein
MAGNGEQAGLFGTLSSWGTSIVGYAQDTLNK